MKLTKQLLKTTDAYIKKLEKGGITSVEDMLFHFPRTLEDTSDLLQHFAYVNIKEKNTLLVTIANMTIQRTKFNKTITKLIVSDSGNQLVECVYFRAPYQLRSMKTGDQVIIHGKPKYEYGKLSFAQPDIEPYQADRQEFIPIYPEIHGISSKWLHGKMKLLKKYTAGIEDNIPSSIREEKKFRAKHLNIAELHFPRSIESFEEAKRQLAYCELWEIQHQAVTRKLTLQESSQGSTKGIEMQVEDMKEWISELPFSLTSHQKIALFEVLSDMEKPHSMQRLLQGDVGTGKTIIAFLTMLHAIRHGKVQCAYMAPTAILATQIYESASHFFKKHDIQVSLLIGSMKTSEKKQVKEGVAKGDTHITIGTHALIQDDVVFNNLGYAIIDEQHRFGVEQRTKLYESKDMPIYPHVLMMTATPIPRTLSMTLYGDQDISIIREYPANRKPIQTAVVMDHQKAEVYNFVENQVHTGRQVYWISPLVEESAKLELQSVTETTEKLKQIFPKTRVEMLHGRMRQSEKDIIMDTFVSGNIHILSSTSVVEVGVNNPNATVIVIENAERFGLSQLHQFRGRVGRGEHQSYCYLFSDKGNNARLKALEGTNDGFELSEIDLELRGPGEVYGVRQSGVPDLKLASLTDLEQIYEIRKDIEKYLEDKK